MVRVIRPIPFAKENRTISFNDNLNNPDDYKVE